MAGLFLSACNEKDESVPAVQTGEITMVDSLIVVTAVIQNDPGNIIEYGFIWGIDPDNVAAKKITCGTIPLSDVYESRIGREDISLAYVEYRVRAFVRNDSKTFYGREVKFLSIAGSGPRINYFEPDTGGWGDTVSIHGYNFLERPGSTKVYIGSINLKIEAINDSLAVVVIPANLGKVESVFTVTNSNITATSKNKFKILPPVLKSISPDSATVGTSLTMKGKRFSSEKTFVNVMVDGKAASVQLTSDSLITFVMPSGITSSEPEISIKVLGQESDELLNIINARPLVKTVSPSVWPGDQITIEGKYFGPYSPYHTYTRVYVNGSQCTINQVSDTLIKATLPVNLETGPATIRVTTESRVTEVDGKLVVNGPTTTGIEPQQAVFGDEVVISGEGFTEFGVISVSFDEFEANITEIQDNLIKVIVPGTISRENTKIRLKTGDRTFYTSKSFRLLLPVIHDVNPKQFTFLDTITLTGEYFNPDPTNYRVMIGAVVCPVIEASETNLVVVVPTNYVTLTGWPVLVRIITNNTLTSDGPIINLKPPEILDVNPKQFTFLDTITITGTYFNPDPATSRIHIGSNPCTIIDGNREQIRARVHVTYSTATGGAEAVTLWIGNFNINAYGPAIDLIEPEVTSVNPASVTIGDTITITGNHFNPVPSNNSVKLGTQALSVITGSSTVLLAIADHPSSGEYNLAVKAGNKTSTQPTPVTIYNPFSFIDLLKDGQIFGTKRSMIAFITGGQLIAGQGEYFANTNSTYFGIDPEIPKQLSSFTIADNNLTYGAFSFCYSDQGYVLSNGGLFKYDDGIPGYSMVSQYPGEAIRYQSGFVIGDKLYIGTGTNAAAQTLDEFWEYNLVSGVWTRKASFPGGPIAVGTAFAIFGKGYMGFGSPIQRNLYEYDPGTDTWSYKCQIPDLVTDIDKGRYALVSIAIGGRAIVGLGRSSTVSAYGDLYSYDPVENSWEKLRELGSGIKLSYPVMITDGEFGYIIGGYYLPRLQLIKFRISDL
ncbi:MAG: IPT/TIG domain-containing protein [Bacteroidales bacterium]